jgi:hypothetical protein
VLMGRREAPLHAAVSVLAAENVQAAFATGDVRNAEDCARIVAAAIQKCAHTERTRERSRTSVRHRGPDGERERERERKRERVCVC